MRSTLAQVIGIENDEKQTVDEVLLLIKQHLQQQGNETLHHVRFKERKQHEGEAFDKF